MPQVIKKGYRNMLYVNCDYCDSLVSFYKDEVFSHTEEVFDRIHTWGDITCPACNKKITVISDGDWKKGVTNA